MEATDETVEEEAEEDCSKTGVATGVTAATSDAEAAATAASAEGLGDDGDSDCGSGGGCVIVDEAGAEFWDDSLPDTLGNEHTSHVVMSSWFWNVQRLQVHCSPVLVSPPLPPPPEGTFGPTAGADIDCPRYRPSIVYDEVAVTAAAAPGGVCCCRLDGILGGGGRGGRGGRFAIEPPGRTGDPENGSKAILTIVQLGCWKDED